MSEKVKVSKWRRVGKKRCTTLTCKDTDSGDSMQVEICIDGKWKRRK